MAKPRAPEPDDEWTADDEPAQERYRAIIVERGRELGEARGWKQTVAGELEIRPDHLSRILRRRRRVSLQTMQRAAARLGFSSEYFFADLAPGATYRDFRNVRRDAFERDAASAVGVLEPASSWKPAPTIADLAEAVNASMSQPVPDLEATQKLAKLLLGHPAIVRARFFVDPEFLTPRTPHPENPEWLRRARLNASVVAQGAVDLLGKDEPWREPS